MNSSNSDKKKSHKSCTYSIDPLIFRSLLEAATEVFSVQLQSQLGFSLITGKKNLQLPHVDIASTLGLVGSKQVGMLSSCLPASTFFAIYERLLGDSISKISPENADAIAEIMNMIFGVFKAKVNPCGFDFSPSLPNIIFGSQLDLSHLHGPQLLQFLCQSDLGVFTLEISLMEVIE